MKPVVPRDGYTTQMAANSIGASSALAVIPQGASLVEREAAVVEWIEDQRDADEIKRARALLAAWRAHAERGSAEREAAIRLDLRCERRLGQLPEAAALPRGGDMANAQPVRSSHAEGMALSRARALAAIPDGRFEEVLAEPKPSREKLLAAAVVPEPTMDPSAEESSRILRTFDGPSAGTWPRSFDVAMMNENAILTIRETVETWRRWCDQWDAALADAPRIRRIK